MKGIVLASPLPVSAGWQLAEWIVEGEPTIDMLGVDPRRYGSYTTQSYLKVKTKKPMPMSL